ncbi:MAG: STAS domain-containing protein, partial [Isosphaeraceae bacterium]
SFIFGGQRRSIFLGNVFGTTDIDAKCRGISPSDGVSVMLAGKPAFLFLTVKEVDGVAVITFLETASMIEADKVDSLAKELFGLIETKKYKKILLNLYNAGYMSSAMLAQVVRLHRKMQDVKGKVRLCCLRPPVMDAFKVSQFDRLFEIFPDEPTALKKF